MIYKYICTSCKLDNIKSFLYKTDPETGEEIPGLIRSLSGFTYDEEDYPSSQNRNSMQVFTPAEVKDKERLKSF